jgi:hypothetical protein
MAHLVIVTHEYDVFARRHPASGEIGSPYLLFGVLRHLETMGHGWQVARGPKPVSGDAALLHVDSTLVDEEYLALAADYPLTINFGTGDISKRTVSRLILARDDAWDGPVIVKADLNNNAVMEDLHNRRALRAGRPLPHPGVAKGGAYRVLDRLDLVEEEVWADPGLIVERFLPERDEEGGFVLRTWVFMGERERCTRLVTSGPISKAADVVRYEPVEVPPELRAERERLNFDFGKFDFVIHDGTPVLLDANRTPGGAQAIQHLIRAGAPNLAEGLDELLQGVP